MVATACRHNSLIYMSSPPRSLCFALHSPGIASPIDAYCGGEGAKDAKLDDCKEPIKKIDTDKQPSKCDNVKISGPFSQACVWYQFGSCYFKSYYGQPQRSWWRWWRDFAATPGCQGYEG